VSDLQQFQLPGPARLQHAAAAAAARCNASHSTSPIFSLKEDAQFPNYFHHHTSPQPANTSHHASQFHTLAHRFPALPPPPHSAVLRLTKYQLLFPTAAISCKPPPLPISSLLPLSSLQHGPFGSIFSCQWAATEHCRLYRRRRLSPAFARPYSISTHLIPPYCHRHRRSFNHRRRRCNILRSAPHARRSLHRAHPHSRR
jgi:hypothetical protein